MKMEDLPNGFKLNLNGEVYRYDKKKDQWFLGKKPASDETVKMFPYIIKQLDESEATESMGSNAELQVDGGTPEATNEAEKPDQIKPIKSPKALPSSLKADIPPGEKTMADVRSERLVGNTTTESSSKKPLMVKIQNVAEMAKAFATALVKEMAREATRQKHVGAGGVSMPGEEPPTADAKKEDKDKPPSFGDVFKQKMREKNPYLRFFTNKFESAEDIAKGRTPKQRIFDPVKDKVKNVASRFRRSEVGQKIFESAPAKKLGEIYGKTSQFVGEKVGTPIKQLGEKLSGIKDKFLAPELAEAAEPSMLKPEQLADATNATEEIAQKPQKSLPARDSKTGRFISKEAAEATSKAESKGFGKLLKGIGGKATGAFGKTFGKISEKFGAKELAKIGGKTLLKKIPFVGAGAGLLFGAQRALAGDYSGAALEVASGAASTIPLAGTAASAGIDAALAAKDAGVFGSSSEQAAPVEQPAITPQAKDLAQTQKELKKTQAPVQMTPPAPIVINKTNNMQSGGGGGGGGYAPTAAPRGSLATNYFAF
jgi:hypothetical protein